MVDYYETQGYGYVVTDTGRVGGRVLGRFKDPREAKEAVKSIRNARIQAVAERAHQEGNVGRVDFYATCDDGYRVTTTGNCDGKVLGRFDNFRDAKRPSKPYASRRPVFKQPCTKRFPIAKIVIVFD